MDRQTPQALKAWIEIIAVLLVAGAFLQTSRTTASTTEKTLVRVEALERSVERTAELQKQSASVLESVVERLHNHEVEDAKDSERVVQLREDLKRVRDR